ncbi:MAG: hypothetical protein IKY18_06560 [Oscillospiraceae bacterium]|nr:hypothetical protein [Oscillospiraceae bacterium]
MRNYDHLRQLAPRALAEAIINISENCCLCCPRERERRCNEDCESGLMEWLLSKFIPSSVVWKKRRKK